MLTQAKWLRRLIRRKMVPIKEEEAFNWKRRLSWAYMIIGWNAIGFLTYAAYKGKMDWADFYGLKTEEEKLMKNNEYFARTIGRPYMTTQLVSVKGITKVESREFNFEGVEPTKKGPISQTNLRKQIQQRQEELERAEKARLEEMEAAKIANSSE